MIKTIPAWSISRLLDFERCHHRSYLQIIVKSEQPEIPDDHPMLRGSRIHEEVEMYISGKTDAFPSSGKKLESLLEYCREQYTEGNATVEDQWGLDEDWGKTGWYDDNVWLRAATDCMIFHGKDSAEIYDWKTGKSFGNEVKYMQQMQVYAIAAFMLYPDLQLIDVSLGFLDDGKLRTKHFERGPKIDKLLAKFTERGNRMTNCVDFRPNPTVANCKWCPFGPGGTNACQYGAEPL